MRISKRRVHLLVICTVVVCCLLLVPTVIIPALTPVDVGLPIERAIAYFEGGSGDPYTLLFLDVLYRRFGIADFSDALQRYDQVIEETIDDSTMLRLFRRISDYDTPYEADDFNKIASPYDLITIPALYCDLVGLPPTYVEHLEGVMDEGGYTVTHVLLALIWMEENECEVTLPDGFVETVYEANADLIDEGPDVYDIELEAAAFLYLAGQGARVSDVFVERMVEAQNTDGSWGTFDDNWHTTVLALTVLLHAESPTSSYPPMLAR